MRAPVAANGWPRAIEPPLTLSRDAVDLAQRRARPSFFANSLRGERLEVGRDLGGEGLVHVDEVDVRERQPGAVERHRRGVGRALQQLSAGIDRGVGVGAQVAERLEPERLRLLLAHHQQRRGAVGERRGVAGGDGAVLAIEHRLELGRAPRAWCPRGRGCPWSAALSYVGGTATCITSSSKTPVLPGARRRCWCEASAMLVLLAARDAVLLGHLLGALAHGLSPVEYSAMAGGHGDQVLGLEPLEGADLLRQRAGADGRHQRAGRAGGW